VTVDRQAEPELGAPRRQPGALGRAWADLPLRAKGLVVVAIPLGALLVAMVLFGVALAQDRQAQASVLHAVEVERQVAQVRNLLGTGVGNFLLTGQERYLDSYNAASRQVPGALARLGDLVRDNPRQAANLRQVTELAARRSEIAAAMIAAARSHRPQRTRLELLERNRQASTAMLDQINVMRSEEQRLFAEREARARRVRSWALDAIVLSGLLGLAGGLAAILLFTSGVTRRASRLQRNAELLADGLPLLPALPGNDELGRLGHGLDRTAALLGEREQALHEARLAAERANQAKSDYLSRMSHELRTPLNAIVGFAQLLELEEVDEQQRESVRHILSGGRHLLGLINEVLDIAAIEAGRLPLSLEPVAVDEVVGEAFSLIRPLADEHSILLVAPTQDCDHYVLGDRQRLKQILLNLLSNAVKYNRVGGSVQLTCERRPDERLRIKVTDTGPGISPEGLQRIFVPFERINADQNLVEGTGLGLPLSQRLAEAMGGTLGVATAVEQGSAFWVDLALTDGPTGENEQPLAASRLAAAEPERSGQEVTVLCIEDNLSNLQLVEQIMNQRPGVELISAMRPELGIELAVQHRPDLVLLDLHLPDMPGEDVLHRLRTNPRTADVPVVILSADARPDLSRRLLEQGAHGFLTKPLDVKELLGVVDEVVATRDRAGSRLPGG
jgi:signal transduction histidine kinase/CheY-like chemotaxis protein